MLYLGAETSVAVVIQEPLTNRHASSCMLAREEADLKPRAGVEEGGPLQRPQAFCFRRT